MDTEQEQRLISLKQTFPFRICWAALRDDKFELHTDYTRRKLNTYLRKGWQVFEAKAG